MIAPAGALDCRYFGYDGVLFHQEHVQAIAPVWVVASYVAFLAAGGCLLARVRAEVRWRRSRSRTG